MPKKLAKTSLLRSHLRSGLAIVLMLFLGMGCFIAGIFRPFTAVTKLWLFENGEFVGTELLIRPDLYCGADVTDPAGTCTRNAPQCESTGNPYFFQPVIGYYECVHTPGQ